ncbi:hypothetical protein BDA96_02G230900 [Sorghum bicolor]|uniref:Uncharacterized protein n=1 Tax=Sorghum bicolor TaxID=4558 RepID=A0A921UTH3_SORBI|nr:hypothetical protein BDA96_02G230900 [Sorghum bicolor]
MTDADAAHQQFYFYTYWVTEEPLAIVSGLSPLNPLTQGSDESLCQDPTESPLAPWPTMIMFWPYAHPWRHC